MTRNLTDLFIKGVKPPPQGRLVIADAEIRGLALRVTPRSDKYPNGTKSWIVRYRVKGETGTDSKGRAVQRCAVLPTYPIVTLSEARARARQIIAAAKNGDDLVAAERGTLATKRKDAVLARTMKALIEEYIEKHAKPHYRRWRDVELRLENHVLPTLGARDVKTIVRGDIAQLLDHLEHGKGLRRQVNHVRGSLSSMFKFAIERQYVEVNPVVGTIHRGKLDSARERVLDDAELKAIWSALADMPDPGRSFVKTLMLTGCRRDEARQMVWSEISPDGLLWTIPKARNKSERDFEIPLSRQMVELFAALPRRGKTFVFTLTGAKAWGTHTAFKAAFDNKSGVSGWTYHDLRRTARTRLSKLVNRDIAERAVGHVVGSKTERTYDRESYRTEKAAALQAWANALTAIVGEGADNVTRLDRRA